MRPPELVAGIAVVTSLVSSLVSSPVAAERVRGAATRDTISEAELVQRLRARADSLSSREQFSGVILLTKGTRTVFEHAYGFANREAHRQNGVGTAFNFSSIGKLFTQAAVWQLVDAGKLSPDSMVGHYLPDYPNKEVARTVTVRQLLEHRSGVGGNIFDTPPSGKRRDVRSTRDYLALIANAPMEFPAGTRQSYSNAGYIILGALIERVSGEDYYTYVQKHVLTPAGLPNTNYYFADSLPTTAATGYTRATGNGNGSPDPDAPLHPNSDMLPGRGSSAGGGYSTVDDLARFSRALRDAKIPGFANVRHGATAGGSPGSNGIVEEDLPGGYDVVVLTNFDPPSALTISTSVRNWLLGRPADAPDPRMRVGGPPANAPTPAGAPAPAPAQATVDLTSTSAGRAAAAYIRAFNTGDEAAMRTFVETSLVPNPSRTTEQRLQAYHGMRDDLGGITPFSSTVTAPDQISVSAHAAKGGDVTLIFSIEHAAPHRITSLQVERD